MKKIMFLSLCFILILTSNSFAKPSNDEFIEVLTQGFNNTIYEKHVENYGIQKANLYSQLYMNDRFQNYVRFQFWKFVNKLTEYEKQNWNISRENDRIADMLILDLATMIENERKRFEKGK